MIQKVSIPNLIDALDADPPDVSQEIGPYDGMYDYAPDLYFKAGRQALRCIRLAMLASKLDTVENILDFASGGGRVLRFLKAAFPDATLTACDILDHQVEFCSEEFGATGVVSDPKPDQIELDGPFDLIWCGSLFTHVDKEPWDGFLSLFQSILAPGGIVVFTAYGRSVAENLRVGPEQLNLTSDQVKDVLRDYDATGFGFAPNVYDGDCVVSRSWLMGQLDKVPELELLLYIEAGWLGQDVIACSRLGSWRHWTSSSP